MTVWLFTTLKEQQLDEVLEIEQASFRRPWNRQAFEVEFACRDAARHAILSQDSRRMIGYCFARIVSGEMHLLKIAVAPSWRRSGAATWAMQQCFEMARSRGIQRMTLEVRATNRAAIRLYAKLGFSRIGTRHRYYSDTGEDALVMAKIVERH